MGKWLHCGCDGSRGLTAKCSQSMRDSQGAIYSLQKACTVATEYGNPIKVGKPKQTLQQTPRCHGPDFRRFRGLATGCARKWPRVRPGPRFFSPKRGNKPKSGSPEPVAPAVLVPAILPPSTAFVNFRFAWPVVAASSDMRNNRFAW